MMEKIHCAINSYPLLMILAAAIPLVIAGWLGQPQAADDLSDGDIAVVKRYFSSIDNRDVSAMSLLFDEDAVQHFVGNDPIVGIQAIEAKLELVLSQIASMKTEFIRFVAEGGTVCAHVKHVAVFKAGGAFKNRTGIHPALIVLPESTTVSWQAMATFKLKEGRIVEELIVRDELAILQQLGTITLK